jgi:hypothetical protein
MPPHHSVRGHKKHDGSVEVVDEAAVHVGGSMTPPTAAGRYHGTVHDDRGAAHVSGALNPDHAPIGDVYDGVVDVLFLILCQGSSPVFAIEAG